MNDPDQRNSALDYDIFGERIRVYANDDVMRAKLDESLQAFLTAGHAEPVAQFHITRSTAEASILHGRQINTGSTLVIADRRKLVAATFAALPWQIHVEAFGASAEQAYYYLFEPLLHMVLKRRGTVPWHGAAVARGDSAILIVGESGSGKSTTALSLLLHGYGFIADDELALQGDGAAVRVRSSEDQLHFTDTTAALLDGLPAHDKLPLVRRGRGVKRRIEARCFGPQTWSDGAVVGVVLFPRVDVADDTRLQPLAAAESVRRLLLHPPKEYPALIVDAPSIAVQFDLCTSLAASARCFELVLGRHVGRVPHLIDAVSS